MPTSGVKDLVSGPGIIAAVKGISMGGLSSYNSETFERHFSLKIGRSDSQGDPSTPSLVVPQPGYWRFQWGIRAGTHTLSIRTKQVLNNASRPSVVVKANPDIGINSDVIATAPSSATWVQIGPLSVTATGDGAVWVELHNNCTDFYDDCFFDHLVVT